MIERCAADRTDCRTEAPFTKITMSPIECLGQGQQFVAYGIHPDTGQPYYWPIESIVDILVNDLPTVTEEQVRRAFQNTLTLFPDNAPQTRTAIGDIEPHTTNDNLVATPEAIASAVGAIPNENLHWDDWNRVGMAIFAASSGSAEGFATFDYFSRKSPKYDRDETRHRWRSYEKSPPDRMGFGTLYHLAKENGWAPGTDINFSPNIVLVDVAAGRKS
jgi:hypothetical protein